jgi:hypothetical protein
MIWKHFQKQKLLEFYFYHYTHTLFNHFNISGPVGLLLRYISYWCNIHQIETLEELYWNFSILFVGGLDIICYSF